MTPNRVRVIKELGYWCCTESDDESWYFGAEEDEYYDTWCEAFDRALERARLA